MLKSSIATLALLLPVLSCGSQEAQTSASNATAETAETTAAAAPIQLESAKRELRCGCKIDSVNHCGNYVANGDEWLEISNPAEFGLSDMEWCRVDAAVHPMGTVAGVRKGDKIELTELVVDQ